MRGFRTFCRRSLSASDQLAFQTKSIATCGSGAEARTRRLSLRLSRPVDAARSPVCAVTPSSSHRVGVFNMKFSTLALGSALAGLLLVGTVHAQSGARPSAPVQNTAFDYGDYYSQDPVQSPI